MDNFKCHWFSRGIMHVLPYLNTVCDKLNFVFDWDVKCACVCVCTAKPEWIEKPVDSQLEEGRVGFLHCHTRATPQPEVTWYRNMQPIGAEVSQWWCHADIMFVTQSSCPEASEILWRCVRFYSLIHNTSQTVTLFISAFTLVYITNSFTSRSCYLFYMTALLCI